MITNMHQTKCAPAIQQSCRRHPPLSPSSDKEFNGFLLYFDVIHYKKLLPPREGFERRRAALHCDLPSILPANLIADYTERRCHRVRDFVPLVVAEIPHAVARPGSDGGETFL